MSDPYIKIIHSLIISFTVVSTCSEKILKPKTCHDAKRHECFEKIYVRQEYDAPLKLNIKYNST